jgi:redox-sensitive bicupin YhaK (pirin superfamily)
MVDQPTAARTQAGFAPLAIRRNSEIYAADGGWFRARWHFSFDEYYDTEHMGIGTLRVFNHDTLVPGAHWPMHPHRDIEGISYIPAGEFEHADNLGNDGVLLAGGVQRMTLGSGAYHSERNHSETQEVEFIQMWIMPAERGLPPSIEQRQYGEEDRRNRLLQILRPVGTQGDGVTVHHEVRMFVSRLDRAVSVEHDFDEGRGGYFYLISCEAEVNEDRLKSGDADFIRVSGRLAVNSVYLSDIIFFDTPM